jgi:hypothetical protein
LSDSLAKSNGQSERVATIANFEQLVAKAKDCWGTIRELYEEIQWTLMSIVFEAKQEEVNENEDGEEEPAPTAVAAAVVPEDEDDEVDGLSNTRHGDSSG